MKIFGNLKSKHNRKKDLLHKYNFDRYKVSIDDEPLYDDVVQFANRNKNISYCYV